MMGFIYSLLFTVLLQWIVTKTTRTQKFSTRALIRNLSFTISLYLYTVIQIHTILCILIFPGLEFLIEYLSANGYHIDKYIATEYAYSDFFEEVIEKTKMMSNFSEGNYDGMLGFDTKDHSQKNVERINTWMHKTYTKCFNDSDKFFNDGNGNPCDTQKIKYDSENAKFALISEICGINTETSKDMKILEIGFGKTDFMMYLRSNFNADVSGVSISNEQVKFAKSRGFTAYHMNCWDMTPEKIGTYDMILQCGNIEYLKLAGGDEKDAYTNYGNIIKTLLKPSGKFFVTGLHCNPDFYCMDQECREKFPEMFSKNNITLNDYRNIYLLWKGNDGAYPFGRDAFSKHLENIGFKTTYCEERTNDYYIYSALWMSSLANSYTDMCREGYSLKNLSKALFRTIAAPYYIHTYLCYIPHETMEMQPWTWQFIPQYKCGKFSSPSILLYMLFEL